MSQPTSSFEMDALASKVTPVAADTFLLKDTQDGLQLKEMAFSDLESSILNNVVFNNQANTYIAGSRQDFLGLLAGTSGMNVGGIAGNPTTQVNGDIWLNTSSNQIFGRINGADVDLGSAGGGTGDVVGPASSVDNSLVIFDGTTGKIIQQGTAVDFEPTIDLAGTVTWLRYGIYLSNSVAGPGPSVGWIGNQINEMTINGSVATELQVQQLGILRASATNVLLGEGINLILRADTNDGYIQLESISSPASSGNVVIGRLFMDADNLEHLTIQRDGVEVDLETGGASAPFTWAASDEDSQVITGLLYTTEAAASEVTLTEVILSLKNTPTGTGITVDILKETGANTNVFATIFSTLPVIDINDFTSQTSAITPVFSDSTWEVQRRLQIVLTINDTNFEATGIKVTLA